MMSQDAQVIATLYKSTRATFVAGAFLPRSYFYPDESGPYYIRGEELHISPPGVRVRAVPCTEVDGKPELRATAQRSLF